MLARAGGHTQGIAKSINPVIVRLSTKVPRPQLPKAYFDAMGKIIEDVGNRYKRSVLSMTFQFPRKYKSTLIFANADGTDAFDIFRNLFSRLLRVLADRGVTLVAGAGNDGAVS